MKLSQPKQFYDNYPLNESKINEIDETSSDSSSSSDSDSEEDDEYEPGSNKIIEYTHLVGTKKIRQKSDNGYMFVSDIKKGTGKQWCVYIKLTSTKKFIKELQLTTGLSRDELIIEKSTHNRWIHPYIAIHMCQWISPKLSVEISKFVYNFISGSFIPSEYTRYIETISENKTLKVSESKFKNKNLKLNKEIENFKSENIKLKKEIKELNDTISSCQVKNKKLKRKIELNKTSKNLVYDGNDIKLTLNKYINDYDISYEDNNTILLKYKN